MLRRAAVGLLLVTAAALVVAPLSFYVGARHAHQKYTEEIDRLRRELRTTRQHQGVYLPPERYTSMVGRLEQQRRDIHQKVDHIKTLEEEMQKKEVIFAGLKKALKKKTVKIVNNEEQLCHAKRKMRKQNEPLQPSEPSLAGGQSPLVVVQQDEAESRLSAADRPQSDPQATDDGPAGGRSSLEQRNEAVGRQFHAQFQTDMARLESALETAFQMQRAFCTQMYANLGAAVERRKHEVASLTSLLSALLGSQTEQLRQLEAHAQSEAAGQHDWIGAQLAAVAARRQSQADAQTVLQRQLAAGAEAVLGRLAQLEAGAEQRQAELRRWLQQHDAGLRDTLAELRQLVQQRERQQREEAEERAAALEEENQRLVDRQARLTGQIESLQASLSSIGAALAASSATADQLAAAAAEDGAAAEAALSGRRARLERTGRQEAEFHTAAGQRLERAHTRLDEDTAALDTLFQRRDEEVSRWSAEARAQMESARDGWTPTLAGLTAGWEEHCQQLEQALQARLEAAGQAQRATDGRLRRLAAAAAQSVQTGRQQLAQQEGRVSGEVRQHRQRLAEHGDSTEREAAALTEAVRRRAADVQELLLESLERDVSTGGTPQRRELSYPRYLAATSPHERILQRYRAGRAAQHSSAQPDQLELPELNTSELLEMDTSSQLAKEPATPESEAGPELPAAAPSSAPRRPTEPPTHHQEVLARAPSVSDVSDAGSDVENKGPEVRRQKAKDGFAVPAARRHTRRALRQPKVHVSRQASQSPRQPGVLTPKND